MSSVLVALTLVLVAVTLSVVFAMLMTVMLHGNTSGYHNGLACESS